MTLSYVEVQSLLTRAQALDEALQSERKLFDNELSPLVTSPDPTSGVALARDRAMNIEERLDRTYDTTLVEDVQKLVGPPGSANTDARTRAELLIRARRVQDSSKGFREVLAQFESREATASADAARDAAAEVSVAFLDATNDLTMMTRHLDVILQRLDPSSVIPGHYL